MDAGRTTTLWWSVSTWLLMISAAVVEGDCIVDEIQVMEDFNMTKVGMFLLFLYCQKWVTWGQRSHFTRHYTNHVRDIVTCVSLIIVCSNIAIDIRLSFNN